MARIADPNRRNDILDAARIVFNDQGYAQTRMADVAKHAGIAPGTIYLYFASKEAIVLALAEQCFVRLSEQIMPAFDLPDMRDVVLATVHAAFQITVEERTLLRFAHFNIGPTEELQTLPAKQAFTTALAGKLAERMERGEIHRYEPHILAELLIGMIERVMEMALLRGQGDLSQQERTITELLQNALLPVEHTAPAR